MSSLQIRPMGSLGLDFIAAPFLPEGQDEYYLRNEQSPRPASEYRSLTAAEIDTLVANGNTADTWDHVHVCEPFPPHQLKNCQFYGLVRIGRLDPVVLEHHDLAVPVGITDSRIIACDLGDNVAVHHVRYLAHYIVGDECMLLNLDEMHCTNHAKFGNGIVKEGEPASVRIGMDLVNEVGGRRVLPFDGMTAGDAYLWVCYRDDATLMARFGELTQRAFDARRGFYGTVGGQCVIKNSRIIKDVKVGDACYIKGANKLKNLTINSTADEPTQIGEGVELVNGIVGAGCHVFYGCKAVRFVMGPNSNLKYGARLIHSYLGDNSTVSCCEILNNLVFPAHEQHHNNSFLIASLIKGQSNVAACATIGSNHNSRAPDGEIHAGRGFWPGLCVSVKHNCRFASFTLLARSSYPAEMDIRLPFSLVSDNPGANRLQVMPAYWWRHNMYALARNAWKFRARDARKHEVQHVEFEALAPDTVEEVFTALELLERWTAIAHLRQQGEDTGGRSDVDLTRLGRELLDGPAEAVDALEVLGEHMEKSRRKVVILSARAGYRAYREMLHAYAVKHLVAYGTGHAKTDLASMCEALAGSRCRAWVNVGGQLVMADDLDALRADIREGRLDSWDAIHAAYDRFWEKYPWDRQRHALATLMDLLELEQLTPAVWAAALDRAVEIQRDVADAVYRSRKKDYDCPFRQTSYETPEEMAAVLGTPEDDSFVRQVAEETEAFARDVEALMRRG